MKAKEMIGSREEGRQESQKAPEHLKADHPTTLSSFGKRGQRTAAVSV